MRTKEENYQTRKERNFERTQEALGPGIVVLRAHASHMEQVAESAPVAEIVASKRNFPTHTEGDLIQMIATNEVIRDEIAGLKNKTPEQVAFLAKIATTLELANADLASFQYN